MLCPSAFQSPFGPLLDLQWPVRSLWPETRPLFYRMEQEMREMRSSLESMERLRRRVLDWIDHAPPSSAATFQPISFQPISFQPTTDGDGFAVTLDTKDFAPEELSVKQVGRKLRVSGRSEKRRDDGEGSYSYRCQEFRQEFDLPDGVQPEAVTCSLHDGQLQIQAPKEPTAAPGERVVPITRTPAVNSAPATSPEEKGSLKDAVEI